MASTNALDPSSAAEAETPGEATLLVSEFPPPPFYYTEAATLKPPPIPKEALERGTRRAAAAAAAARAEAERQRLADQTGDVLGGVLAGNKSELEEEEGDVVGVFGEIVEDPLLVKPLDSCEDPVVIRDEVKRLNKEVVQGFINLLNDLVNRPAENKCVTTNRMNDCLPMQTIFNLQFVAIVPFLTFFVCTCNNNPSQKTARRTPAQCISHAPGNQ